MPHAIFTELVLYDEEHSNDWMLRIRVDRNKFLGPRVASGE